MSRPFHDPETPYEPMPVVSMYANAVRDSGASPEQGLEPSSLLLHGFDQMKDAGPLGKQLLGRFASHYTPINQNIDAELYEIHPDLPQDCLVTRTYWTKETCAFVDILAEEMRNRPVPRYITGELNLIRARRQKQVEALAGSTFLPILQPQRIAEDILAKPRFYHEGDDGVEDIDQSSRGCANACFRMICAEIIGQDISSSSVAESCKAVFGTTFIDNYRYLNFFHSDALHAATPKAVTTVDMIGADFTTIATIAAKARQKDTAYQTYCITPIASKSLGEGALHQVVLLGTDERYVYVHDPRRTKGGANHAIYKDEFVKRWAMAFNEAILVIAG